MSKITPYELSQKNYLKKQEEFKKKQEELKKENKPNPSLIFDDEYNKWKLERDNHLKKTNEFLIKFHDDLSNNKYPEISKKSYDYLINSGPYSQDIIIHKNQNLLDDTRLLEFPIKTILKNNYSDYIDSINYVISNSFIDTETIIYKITNPNSILNGFELGLKKYTDSESWIYIGITRPLHGICVPWTLPERNICNIL